MDVEAPPEQAVKSIDNEINKVTQRETVFTCFFIHFLLT